jgi:hypothetical protein
MASSFMAGYQAIFCSIWVSYVVGYLKSQNGIKTRRPVNINLGRQQEKEMTKEKFMFKFDVCGEKYQHGPHRYEGHGLKLYGNIFCCDLCWEGNCIVR